MSVKMITIYVTLLLAKFVGGKSWFFSTGSMSLNELAFSPRPGRSIFQRFSLLSMAFCVVASEA
jgi:hypothetical protein